MTNDPAPLPQLILQVLGPQFRHLERTWVKGEPTFALVFDNPAQRIPIGNTNKLYNLKHVRKECYGARGCAVPCAPKQWPEVMQQLFGLLVDTPESRNLVDGIRRYIEAHPVSDTPCLDAPFQKGNAVLVHGSALFEFLRQDWTSLHKRELDGMLRRIGAWSAQINTGTLRKYFWHIPKDRLDLEKDRNTDT